MKGDNFMLFLTNGLFHLEPAMIYNPYLHALRYDPYGKTLMDERYDTKSMNMIWKGGIEAAGIPDSKYSES